MWEGLKGLKYRNIKPSIFNFSIPTCFKNTLGVHISLVGTGSSYHHQHRKATELINPADVFEYFGVSLSDATTDI